MNALTTGSLLVALAGAAHAQEPAPDRDLQEIAPGVFAALQPDERRFDDANSMIVVTYRDVLVVDTPTDPARTQRIHQQVDRFERPVRWLVNTHWHSDHVSTNALWKNRYEQLLVVGHESLREDFAGRTRPSITEQVERLQAQIPAAREALAAGRGLGGQELDPEQQQAQRRAIDAAGSLLDRLRETKVEDPDVTYSERLVLHRDSGNIELLHFRGHTRGDTVVWLPRQRVLATGDLLDELPFGGHGYPSSWLAALETLRELEPRLVVPGHGPVQTGTARLELAIELWQTLIDHYGAAHDRGESFEDATEALDLSDLRDRFCAGDETAERNWRGFTPASQRRVWQEVRGEIAGG
ncbi:MAG: MBL fold metallo-hydrolase [Acidobacteriota bacterium]